MNMMHNCLTEIFTSSWSDNLTKDQKFDLPYPFIHRLIKFDVSDITIHDVKSCIGNINYQYQLCCSLQVYKNKLFYHNFHWNTD